MICCFPKIPVLVVSGTEKSIIWNTWGEILNPPADAQVWATYKNEFYEGSPAVTFRKLGKGTITYVGVDSHNGALEKDILKKLYVQLNIPVMDLPYGVTMEYRNGLGIVLNYSDQPYTFNLSKGAKALIGTTEIPTAGVFGVFSEISVEKNYVTIKLFIMRLFELLFLIGGILIASCVGNSSNKSQMIRK